VVSPIAFSAVFDDMFWGQIATALTLAIVADFLLVRGRYQGVLVGLATSLKIYPGVFIVMWLVRRQYRQACTALITVIVVTGAACLLWYHSAVSFYHNQVLGGQELGRFSVSTTAQGSSSIADLFLRPPDFLGHLSAHNSLIIVGVFVIFGVITSYGAWRHGYELTAVLVGLDISIICSPIAWNHYFAFLPLLVFVPFEIGWHRWTTRAAYFAMVVNMVPWHRWRDAGAVQILMPKGQLYLSFVAQNATLVSMLLFLFAAAYEFWPESLMLPLLRRRRSSTRRTDPPAATAEPLREPSHTVAPRSRVTHAPLDQ
jgi:alpha-1,2-mannosyltransferase